VSALPSSQRVKLAPSLLSADFGAFADAAALCAREGAEHLHFDVMDGRFVPNITFGRHPLTALRPYSEAVFEAHLMIVEPERYIDDFAAAGAQIITIHPEATVHLQRSLAQIRQAGAKAGLALNPATPLSVLDYVMDDLDLILVMTVNPGFGGQEFIPAMMRKISDTASRIRASEREIELEVDGGIGPDNAAAVVAAGATILVAGTSIFAHPGGAAKGIPALREALPRRV
jgi:ribulose-phosphate 3-epimerase